MWLQRRVGRRANLLPVGARPVPSHGGPGAAGPVLLSVPLPAWGWGRCGPTTCLARLKHTGLLETQACLSALWAPCQGRNRPESLSPWKQGVAWTRRAAVGLCGFCTAFHWPDFHWVRPSRAQVHRPQSRGCRQRAARGHGSEDACAGRASPSPHPRDSEQ